MNINLIITCITIIVLIVGLFSFHHFIVKSEDNKIQAQSESIVIKVQNDKSKINNTPRTDKYSINRLLSGSF